MIDTEIALAAAACLTSAVSLVVSIRKKRGLSLTEIAIRGIAAAEQLGASNDEKMRKACQIAIRLDEGDNGKRDWSDAQIRLAIEAELKRVK